MIHRGPSWIWLIFFHSFIHSFNSNWAITTCSTLYQAQWEIPKTVSMSNYHPVRKTCLTWKQYKAIHCCQMMIKLGFMKYFSMSQYGAKCFIFILLFKATLGGRCYHYSRLKMRTLNFKQVKYAKVHTTCKWQNWNLNSIWTDSKT